MGGLSALGYRDSAGAGKLPLARTAVFRQSLARLDRADRPACQSGQAGITRFGRLLKCGKCPGRARTDLAQGPGSTLAHGRLPVPGQGGRQGPNCPRGFMLEPAQESSGPIGNVAARVLDQGGQSVEVPGRRGSQLFERRDDPLSDLFVFVDRRLD